MSRDGGGGGCCPPMDLLRSEAMQLVQVIIPAESARLAVSNLGDLGLVQFKDVRIRARAHTPLLAYCLDFNLFPHFRSIA